MVVRVYCDRCNKDITNEMQHKHHKIYIEIDDEVDWTFIFCEDCFNTVYNHISKIVPEEIWDGSPDYPTKKEE